MLNYYQLTMAEAVFLAIDSYILSESYCYELVDHFRKKQIKKHTNIYGRC